MATLVDEVAAPRRRFFRPTWAEVDLAALVGNLRRLRAKMPSKTLVMFVVKANAYGHGAAECARAAQAARAADWLGVSSVEEGVALREAGLKLPILVLGSLYPFESVLAAVAHALTPVAASLESARRVAEVALRLRRSINIHVKVDTGMGRIGVRPEAAPALVRQLADLRAVRVQGIYTHLACGEDDAAFTAAQLKAFRGVVSVLSREGLRPPLVHAANSAGALRHPSSRFDMIRPGLAVYGLYPGFDPVLTLKSKIVFLKTVAKGAAVSYGATWRARRPTRVATLPIGYGDGYSRALSNRAEVLIGGRRCPVVGRVTMDQTMVDVTGAPRSRVGDDAVLIGAQGGERIEAGELSRLCGTIPYETATAISSRVPRVGVAG
ncbi:MAG: alanine racemase [Elusimicrobia bacterium RBG_16_66_12]|nr:MAG: alanine racemase [Elusimicrobia bacterium RBG_16_66_12]